MENDIVQNDLQQPVIESKSETSGNSCGEKKCKCCINLILNIIAMAGIIVLFILYFTGYSCSHSPGAKFNKTTAPIGFVNSDSVMANYEFVKVIKVSLEAKQKEAEDNFSVQQKTFETQVAEYQKKIQANSITNDQAKNTERILAEKQQNLLDLKDQLTQTLSEEQYKMNIMLLDSITNFLKRYNQKYNYNYIFGYSKGSNLLFANDSLDLTKEVIKGLNKEYKSQKKEK